VPQSFPDAVPAYEVLGAGRGPLRQYNRSAPLLNCRPSKLRGCRRPALSALTMLRARLYKAMAARWLGIGVLVLLGFGVAGCAALIVGSVVGSLDLAGYEYVKASAPAPQTQPSAQPKLSLNDIE